MDNLEQLEKLASLKEKGVITEEEFQQQKTALLAEQGNKSQFVYCILAFFLGSYGIHNFYAARWKRGLAQLLMTIIGFFFFRLLLLVPLIWTIVNIFKINTDGHGKNFIRSNIAKYIFGILLILLYSSVFILGGIAGYTSAMRKYHANEAINAMKEASVIAKSANNGLGSDIGIGEYENATHQPLPTAVKAITTSENGRVITVEFTPENNDVCQWVAKTLGPQKAPTGCTENKVTASF